MALHNVSTITITQTESGQTAASTCPGSVKFHVADKSVIRHYTTPAGAGHDCTDNLGGTYEAGAGTAAAGAVHAVTITVVEDFDTVTVEADV